MNLQLDESLAANYKSASQKIRVMSESWLLNNLFCPCCGNEHIDKIRNNAPVADVRCNVCGEIFELKSKRNRLGAKIPDGAYHTMIERITSNINPQLFLIISCILNVVLDLLFVLVIPARRAGWVGCNILYQKIPAQGKIIIIRDGKEIETEKVLRLYDKIKKLQTNDLKLRGWLMDVLNCVNEISAEVFTLQEVYGFAEQLSKNHLKPNSATVKKTLRLGVPVALQNSMIAFSLIVLQGIVNSYGAVFTTAFTIVGRIESLVQQPFISLGAAMASYTGQNIGAGRYDRVQRGFKSANIMNFIFAAVIIRADFEVRSRWT